MNLDSIKFKMQLDELDFDCDKYIKRIEEKKDCDTLIKYVLDTDKVEHIGLNGVEILPANNEVIVMCSAKILQEQYLEGINQNTLERVSDVVGEYICCSWEDVFESQLLRADITKNLYFPTKEEKEIAIASTKLGKSNTAFKVDDYTDKRESIIFTGREKTFKNRQIYYNKIIELHLARNKDILEILVKNNVKDIDKIFRVEQNITSTDRLRLASGQKKINCRPLSVDPQTQEYNKTIQCKFSKNINKVKLAEMVSSKENPLLDRHREIMKYASNINLFADNRLWEDMLLYTGVKGVYESCGSDLETVFELLKYKTIEVEGKDIRTYYRRKKKFLTYFSNNIVSLVTQNVTPVGADIWNDALKKLEDLLAAS